MNAYGRFEILLPLTFNDGRPVPREFLADAAAEIQSRFGGVSWESDTFDGISGSTESNLCGRRRFRGEPAVFYRSQNPPEVAVLATGHLAHSSSNRNFVKSSKLSSRCDYTARNAPMQL